MQSLCRRISAIEIPRLRFIPDGKCCRHETTAQLQIAALPKPGCAGFQIPRCWFAGNLFVYLCTIIIIMETLLLQTESKKDIKMLAELAKKIGFKATYISQQEMEDIG